jgi:hypothetical protein
MLCWLVPEPEPELELELVDGVLVGLLPGNSEGVLVGRREEVVMAASRD